MRRSTAIRLTLILLPAVALAIAAFAAPRAELNPKSSEARLLSVYSWGPPPGQKADWFGGFSAIEVRDAGRKILVLSDRSTLATARISRADGLISAAKITKKRRLRSSTGQVLKGRVTDSEGLVLAPDGSLYISFEGVSRVAHYAAQGANAKPLPRPKSFRRLPQNKSLEALAMDAKGHLYTLPENAPDGAGNLPVWRWDGAAWSQPFTLPGRGGFFPVGADFGPDGRFYLLERKFLLIGFQSRLRRWDITRDGPQKETTLFQSALGTHDNLEGLSVWRDPEGHLRATMISDDNFSPLQRTELVEYRLPD